MTFTDEGTKAYYRFNKKKDKLMFKNGQMQMEFHMKFTKLNQIIHIKVFSVKYLLCFFS
jgi:hypothetical protein